MPLISLIRYPYSDERSSAFARHCLLYTSGIRKQYTPEEMVGKKVMVLVNLKPAKLAGVLSEGMLLCAEDENGELALLTDVYKRQW